MEVVKDENNSDDLEFSEQDLQEVKKQQIESLTMVINHAFDTKSGLVSKIIFVNETETFEYDVEKAVEAARKAVEESK